MVAAGRRRRALGVGVVGCGRISGTYLENLRATRPARAVACADLDPARARAAAAASGVRALAVEDLLADPAVDIVLNLTVPAAHAAVSRAALEAGRHVYSEKPLAADGAAGRELLALARRRGLQIACAPDTFLAGPWETARELIGAGAIGRPVGASAAMHTAGPELWHPDPAFLYRRGAGPLLDMGPYYLTALVSLLGPIERATGLGRIGPTPRVVGSGPLAGTAIDVEVATHVAAALDFRAGAVATLVTSFDIPTRAAGIVVHGDRAVLHLPDPNYFNGPVLLQRPGEARARRVRVAPTRRPGGRGIGVLDLADAITEGRPPRASGELALHVLDAMEAVLGALADGRTRELPAPPG